MPKKSKKSQAKQPPADNLSHAKVAEAAEPLLTDRDALRANRDAAIVAMLKLIADKGPL